MLPSGKTWPMDYRDDFFSDVAVTHAAAVFPGGDATYRLQISRDTTAALWFIAAGDTVYVVGLRRGNVVSGSELLQIARRMVCSGRRLVVVGAAPDVFGFYEKMRERVIIDSWTSEDVESFFGVE